MEQGTAKWGKWQGWQSASQQLTHQVYLCAHPCAASASKKVKRSNLFSDRGYNFSMPPTDKPIDIDILDVSGLSYSERLCAAALQGLVNRTGPVLFLNYGVYDDPAARRTNEVFLDDALWFGKFRDLLGNQDQRNLEYYCREHGFRPRLVAGLDALILKYRDQINGCVLWDEGMPDTANIALMQSALEGLLPIEAGMAAWAQDVGLPILHDLRGKWPNRFAMVQWAFEHFFPQCKPGMIACVEPGWQRPEFVDYLVQNRIFTYSLSSKSGGVGDRLLLLLAFGPAWLREALFALRLDGPIRRLGLALMARRSVEVRLATAIQRAVQDKPNPTIFGWHTRREDELAFLLHLSANGMRLVPSHLAANFSFHSQVKPLGLPTPTPVPEAELDPQGIYLTFTLSDGDQLMMMSTGELGNWHSTQRGVVPFNWETQPLLVELAPALLEKYARTATPNDCLIAGPSGAGYIIPPLAPDLPAYLAESRRICQQAGIRVITTYVADPPVRVLHQMAEHSAGLEGFLAGYAILDRMPQKRLGNAMFIANQWPPVSQIGASAEDVLAGVRRLIAAPGLRPRFIGVHLFAYRTTLADIARFAETLADTHVHIVRADTFLRTAKTLLPNGAKLHG